MTLHKARILLAEDDITIQLATMAVLENLGIEADMVANGQEAIHALQTIAYDLVLMDCQMPLLDGYGATRWIRDEQSPARNHRVPVIAMTADTSKAERTRCLACGMDDFMAKPVAPQAMAEILARWLPCQSSSKSQTLAPSSVGQINDETALPVWDRQGMLARLMGEKQVARVITSGFLIDIPLKLQALEISLAEKDMLTLIRLAHGIRGAAATVGGERLQAAAHLLEQSAPRANSDALRIHIDTIRQEFTKLQHSMERDPLLGEAG